MAVGEGGKKRPNFLAAKRPFLLLSIIGLIKQAVIEGKPTAVLACIPDPSQGNGGGC